MPWPGLLIMKTRVLHILFLTAVLGRAQPVFTEVRKNMSKNDFTRCLAVLDSCYRKSYYADSALYYKTLVSLKTGNVKGAKKVCKELSKTYPTIKCMHYLNGLVYFSDENYGKCIDEFNLALKDDPGNVKIIYNRSVAFGLLEEYLSAIEDLSACIELNPNYSLAYYSRAYWYEFTGNYPEAAKDYEATIRLEPNNYEAYLGLAYVYQNQNQTAKACEAITRAIREGSQIAEDLKENFCK